MPDPRSPKNAVVKLQGTLRDLVTLSLAPEMLPSDVADYGLMDGVGGYDVRAMMDDVVEDVAIVAAPKPAGIEQQLPDVHATVRLNPSKLRHPRLARVREERGIFREQGEGGPPRGGPPRSRKKAAGKRWIDWARGMVAEVVAEGMEWLMESVGEQDSGSECSEKEDSQETSEIQGLPFGEVLIVDAVVEEARMSFVEVTRVGGFAAGGRRKYPDLVFHLTFVFNGEKEPAMRSRDIFYGNSSLLPEKDYQGWLSAREKDYQGWLSARQILRTFLCTVVDRGLPLLVSNHVATRPPGLVPVPMLPKDPKLRTNSNGPAGPSSVGSSSSQASDHMAPAASGPGSAVWMGWRHLDRFRGELEVLLFQLVELAMADLLLEIDVPLSDQLSALAGGPRRANGGGKTVKFPRKVVESVQIFGSFRTGLADENSDVDASVRFGNGVDHRQLMESLITAVEKVRGPLCRGKSDVEGVTTGPHLPGRVTTHAPYQLHKKGPSETCSLEGKIAIILAEELQRLFKKFVITGDHRPTVEVVSTARVPLVKLRLLAPIGRRGDVRSFDVDLSFDNDAAVRNSHWLRYQTEEDPYTAPFFRPLSLAVKKFAKRSRLDKVRMEEEEVQLRSDIFEIQVVGGTFSYSPFQVVQ